jgi:hypothetical protein
LLCIDQFSPQRSFGFFSFDTMFAVINGSWFNPKFFCLNIDIKSHKSLPIDDQFSCVKGGVRQRLAQRFSGGHVGP